MLIVLIITLPIWYIIYAASKKVSPRETGLKRMPARLLLSVVWVIIWFLLVGLVALAVGPGPFSAYLELEILTLGFFAVFRFTRGLRGSAHRSVGEAESRKPISCLSEEADAFLEARRKERDGDLLAKLHEKTPTVSPHEPAPFPRSNE